VGPVAFRRAGPPSILDVSFWWAGARSELVPPYIEKADCPGSAFTGRQPSGPGGLEDLGKQAIHCPVRWNQINQLLDDVIGTDPFRFGVEVRQDAVP